MIRIPDREAVCAVDDPLVRERVLAHLDGIGQSAPYDPASHGPVMVFERGDTLDAVSELLGCRAGSVATMPDCEWADHHPGVAGGGCYEIVFVLDDAGSGVSLFIPESDADPMLLDYCRCCLD